ncbi:L-dopachrome tautomerase-related protein [Thalassomonas actiniarum]|uniref:Major royal jelly protein n=1 Tax=Thalassomonas actiniarum TaxID=485447 RepID=A0AAF0C1N8_9GAMM|nr:L-dopachrome tautomerase-related protein [Thalassomonas actiniarum]WDD96909.1 hypothetical protein SG35_016245 [Thalassomonas actiniarum]
MKYLKAFSAAVMIIFVLNPALATSKLEVYAELTTANPPGNIAVSENGRKFISIHGFYGNELKLAELMNDGSVRPYPNKTWAYAPKNGGDGLHNVLGVNVDKNNILWLLDASGKDRPGKLVGWDVENEKLAKLIYLPKPVIVENSFLNDLAVDADNGYIYIADTAGQEAVIIVVDIKSGYARRVLQSSVFTLPEDIDMVIDEHTVMLEGAAVRLGVNPITIDPTNKWLYFGAMNGTSVYRVDTKHLGDETLSHAELVKEIERYGTKPLSDGITVDGSGNVYVSSITDNSIGVTLANGEYKTLFSSNELSWPDGLAFGPDNYALSRYCNQQA